MDCGGRIDYVVANFMGFMEALEGSGLLTSNEAAKISGQYIQELVKYHNKANRESQGNQGQARKTAATAL